MKKYIDICKEFDVSVRNGKLFFSSKDNVKKDLTQEQFLKLSVVKRHERSILHYLNHPPVEYREIIGVDIETTSLNFRTGKIRLIALYSEERKVVTEDLDAVKSILADPNVLKVFHNCLFDVPFLEFSGYSVINFTDTMIMTEIIENSPKMSSLASLAQLHLGVEINKDYQHSSNWEGKLTSDHYDYCLQDARVTFELYHIFFAKIIEMYLFPTYRREIQALPAVVELMLNGIYFDFNKWHQRLYIIEKEVHHEKRRLEHMLKCSNIDSHVKLKNALNENGITLNGTDEKTLSNHMGKYPLLSDILAYRKLKKIITSYGEKFENFLDDDYRVRSNWNLIGTKTSRMTASKPNLQSIPKEMRSFF